MINSSLSNSLQIGKPWDWDLWPGSLGNVSTGGSFFKFSSDIMPYPVNSNNFFTLKGGRRRRKKSKTSKKRIRRKTRRMRLIKTK